MPMCVRYAVAHGVEETRKKKPFRLYIAHVYCRQQMQTAGNRRRTTAI